MLLILGTVAYDSIRTPAGQQDHSLGGSATYAAYAASFFTKPAIISIVGQDFEESDRLTLTERGIDLSGVKVGTGDTFSWKGWYDGDMNQANTLETNLNVLMDIDAQVPENLRDAKYLLLANIDPTEQIKVIKQLGKDTLVVLDTMNFWIDSKPKELTEAISLTDILILNDGEARQFTNQQNLVAAAETLRNMGPKTVIIKKGEHGLLMLNDQEYFGLPGFPLAQVVDPTGAGDNFAGGFVGYLAAAGKKDRTAMRKAAVYGSVLASYNIEDFSIKRLTKLSRNDIEARFKRFADLVSFGA